MLLFIFCLLFLLISLYITKKVKGTFLCVNSIFNTVWCLFLGISQLKLYGLYSPSVTVTLYSFIVICVFNIVSLIFGYIGNESQIMLQKDRIDYNDNILYMLNILSYVFSSRYLIKSINIIREHGYFMMRYYTTGSGGYAQTSELIIFQWIILPIFILTIIINAINLSKKHIDRVLLIMTILDVILYVLLFGGRYIIVRFVFITVVSYLLFERGNIFKFIKNQKKLIILLSVVFFIIVFLTSKRSISNLNFIGNLITYYTGSFIFVSKLIESNQLTAPLYGRAMFGGLYNFIYALISFAFGVEYNGSDAIITSITSQYLRIGEYTLYNSLTTIIYPFLSDFGVLGLIFDTIIFATTCNFIEKKAYLSHNKLWIVLYLYITFVVFDSVLQYDFLGPINIVLLIFAIVISLSNKSYFIYIKKR